jgi:2-methylcitrate dehydratase PrpD
MHIAERIAERALAIDYENLPDEAVHWAKVGLLDYVGCTIAGCTEPAARIACDVLIEQAGQGKSVILGRREQVPSLDAAVINGTASHALDYDDISNTMGGHPSAPLLSALLALADEGRYAGRRLIAAYVAGFEVETKIARGVHLHHYTKGWHPTSTLGVFGVATACAHLMGLDAARAATAIAIAASSASGIKANFGTMTKPLHVGLCARAGMFAAKLAAKGFTASPNVFEHKQGFLEVYNGAGTYDVERIFERFAAPLDIVSPGIAIKQYPCCGSTHPALDATLALVRGRDLDPGQVAKVRVWLHTRRLEHTNRPNPTSDLEAKFSVQYGVARAITDRRIVMEQFEDNAYRDSKVQALLPLVEASAYTSAQFAPGNHFGAEVEVTLKSGEVLRAKVEQAVGRTADDPLPRPLLREKFVNCCARTLTKRAIDDLYAHIDAVEFAEDMRAITVLATNTLRPN